MSGDTAAHVMEDFFGVVRLFSDGTVVRGDQSVLMPAETVPVPDVPGVQWKDVVYNATRGLKVRVYRPSSVTAAGDEEGGGIKKEKKKLPVLAYFHGGGYCLGAYDQPGIPELFRQRLAASLPAVVLSVQYRLAPEHRLPAAVDDGAAFLSWLTAQAVDTGSAEPWLAESADFRRTFVSGVSAGANLAHHVVVRHASSSPSPVCVVGYVLLSPFFGAVDRAATESAPPPGVSLTVEASDQLWRMALPVGATRDHPLANPFGPGSPDLEPLPLPPALVVAPELDVLRGHVLRYAARMKGMGKAVELAEFPGEQHGFSVLKQGEANEVLMRILKRFVSAQN